MLLFKMRSMGGLAASSLLGLASDFGGVSNHSRSKKFNHLVQSLLVDNVLSLVALSYTLTWYSHLIFFCIMY